jgi:phosphotransferase system  glucose/maltose/N-acetylglucosamine-specific IIC component
MEILWILFGALIGVSASQRRGFGTAAGVIGGMLLGPLAVLMYFVTGDRIRCPHCAEWVNKKAVICIHCKSALSGKAR